MKGIIKQLVTELFLLVEEALKQLIGFPQPKLKYTTFAKNQMTTLGVSEDDVDEVFYSGTEYRKDKSKRYKVYRNYLLWISFETRKGVPTIKRIWLWDGKK